MTHLNFRSLTVLCSVCAVFVATAGFAEDTQPIPQDPNATIDKAMPVQEMEGSTAPNGTDIDVDPNSATVDGVPRTAENAHVNTEESEAKVGIPNSE